MKKVLLSVIVVAALFACKTKGTEKAPKYPENAKGYVLDSSANIELVKKVVDAFQNVDVQANKAFILASYTDTAKIHDNEIAQTLAENIEANLKLKASGAKVTILPDPFIWETVFNQATPNGSTSMVDAYFTYTVEKNGKKVKNTVNTTWEFAGNKIVSEWDLYDSKPIADMFK
jgi:hypothetical protein